MITFDLADEIEEQVIDPKGSGERANGGNGTRKLGGSALLNDVYSFLSRFVAYPSECAHVAHTLWIVHAHLMDAWESTPRIAFLKVGRKTLGPNAGCVIRLWPDDEVERGLVIGEGVETTLAAATRIQHRGTLLTPAWATGDAGHLENFPVLPGIEALTVLVDHDENGRGQRATAECARRWTAAGREVTQLIPRIPGRDFADLVGEPS
jgi:hypothetical protein